MGATSNITKQRWNAKTYKQIKISVKPELAVAFKAKCSADGVSMASKLSQFMTEQVGRVNAGKPLPAPYETRPKRRKELCVEIARLVALLEAEQEYLENIPENLQNSRFAEAAEQTISALEDALDILAEAY